MIEFPVDPELDDETREVLGRFKIDRRGLVRFMTAKLAVLEEDLEDLSDPAYTVFAVWGLYPTPRGNLLFLLDMVRERMEGDAYFNTHAALAKKWKTRFTAMQTKVYETKIVRDMIDRGCRIKRLGDGDDAYAYIDDDPYARIMSATGFLEKHLLFVPESAPWLGDCLTEWTSFPKAKHWDCCEVLTSAIVIAGKPSTSWDAGMESTPSHVDRDAPRDPLAGYYIAKPRGL